MAPRPGQPRHGRRSVRRLLFAVQLFIGLLYFVICFACLSAVRMLERRWAAWGR